MLDALGVLHRIDSASLWLTQWAIASPIVNMADHRLALAVLCIEVAGIALPLYYTVVASILDKSYAKAPERVRELFWSEPSIGLYRRLVVGMGVVGVLVLSLAAVGRAPSSITTALMTILLATSIVSLFWVWARLIELADATRLAGLLYQRVDDTLERIVDELKGNRDAEAIIAFRKKLSNELSTLTELAAHARQIGGTGTAGAYRLTVVAEHVAHRYGAVVSMLPESAPWGAPTAVQPDVIRSGGAMSEPEARVRVFPRPQSVADSYWLDRALGEACASILDLALDEEEGVGLEAVLQGFFDIVESLSKGRPVEGSLIAIETVRASFEVRLQGNLSRMTALIVYDRLGALHAAVIGSLAAPAQDVNEVAAKIVAPVVSLPDPPGGPRYREEFRRLSIELANERTIEGTALTSQESAASRLRDARQRDRLDECRRLLNGMRSFYCDFGSRLARGQTFDLTLAGTVQAFHMLGRVERAFGVTRPPRYALDYEYHEIPPGELRDAVEQLRENLLATSASTIAAYPRDLRDPKLPDALGTAFYFAADEAILGLARSPWPRAGEWYSTFIAAAWRVTAEAGQYPDRPAALVSPLQEAARVGGFLELWRDVRAEDESGQATDAWDTLLAIRTPDEERDVRWQGVIRAASEPHWLNRPRYAVRFNADNDQWNALADLGYLRSIGRPTSERTEKALQNGSVLLLAVSADDDGLHHMDAYFWAICANRIGLPVGELPEDVRNAYSSLYGEGDS